MRNTLKIQKIKTPVDSRNEDSYNNYCYDFVFIRNHMLNIAKCQCDGKQLSQQSMLWHMSLSTRSAVRGAAIRKRKEERTRVRQKTANCSANKMRIIAATQRERVAFFGPR